MSGSAPWKIERKTYIDTSGLSPQCNHEFVNREPSYLDGVSRLKCVKCKGHKTTYPPGYGNPPRDLTGYGMR